jgi:hypothetical protein
MAHMPLTPEEFERAWGADALVRLPAESAAAPIPSDARDFLVRAGLPALVRYSYGSADGKITFCRLAPSLHTALGEPTVGPPLPIDRAAYRILGHEFFCNGAAWWCAHERTGQVDRIDIELNPPIEFASSSVAHLASAVLAAVRWSARCDRSVGEWRAEVDRLRRELTELDPAGMGSDRNFWPAYLDVIRDEEPHTVGFERGSRPDGEWALQEGPW